MTTETTLEKSPDATTLLVAALAQSDQAATQRKIQADAEAQRIADIALAAKKAANASDAEKLSAFADALEAVPVPEMEHGTAKHLVATFSTQLYNLIMEIRETSQNL